MSLKITLTVDPDRGEQLVGLLAKALGRGELGVSDLRIERDGEDLPERAARLTREGLALRAIKQSTVAKMVAARERPKHERQGYYIGMRAVKDGKPNGATVILNALKGEPTRAGLQRALIASGLNRNGLGATLSKLKNRGYVKRIDSGVWRLTPKGEELEQRLSQEVKHGGQD